ncbi:Two-component signal transduction system YycFG, regulatory protein YycI [Melghirimyces thermohalophilus]|uniref:Two-component signal transduction system YycFG, regulatory protein YycI n=1 Tax=Melghirimyces thermohalophilus TaxID=1236220 RepID=A0A1G6M652_9BACL|nr:two-component system regulatory protein YycI [Melghirimyces thermohalophilus]SDC50969.1 Two-component signal transduction system YycFG, regulatory protein YycI [Melghirimyces thermohalophilus]
MDWSKAKTILILAFLALNAFLADQLLQAKGEQAQKQEVSRETQQELQELLDKRHIRMKVDLPKKAFPVTSLDAKPLELKTLHEQDSRWESTAEGSYRLTLEAPWPSKQLEKLLQQTVPGFDQYRKSDESDPDQLVYYQHHDERPIFDSRLLVTMKDGAASKLELYPLKIQTDNNTSQTGLSAQDALVRLIATGMIQKGSTVVDVTLGYHGRPSYEGEDRVLYPVWKIETQQAAFYVNALTQEIEPITVNKRYF